MEWQPIETAPRDGRFIELLNVDTGLLDTGQWCDYTEYAHRGIDGEWNTLNGNGEMTHWKHALPNV